MSLYFSLVTQHLSWNRPRGSLWWCRSSRPRSTLSLLKSRYFWPGMDKDVERKVAICPNCILRKSKSGKSAQLVNITSSHPLAIVCIDYLTLEQSKGGFQTILVITDHCTRYAQPGVSYEKSECKSHPKMLVGKFYPALFISFSDTQRSGEKCWIKGFTGTL